MADRVGLTPWTVVLVLGIISYVFFLVMNVVAGVPATVWDIALYGLVFFVPLVFAALAASVYVRDKMVSLEAYANSIMEDPDRTRDALAPISNIPPIAVLALGISILFMVPYLIEETDRIAVALGTIAWIPGVWFMATALWTLGYSLVGIYRIGKLPMTLRPFTVDRTLGLRPFASTCLRLAAIYYGLVSFTIITDLDAPVTTAYAVLRTFGFAFLGLLLFVLPLWSLHEKLRQAKAEKIVWINERYDRIVRKIESGADGPLEAGIQGELLGIDKIQRDIQSIRTWPFDMNSLAKLITILLSVTAILLARFIAPFLGI